MKVKQNQILQTTLETKLWPGGWINWYIELFVPRLTYCITRKKINSIPAQTLLPVILLHLSVLRNEIILWRKHKQEMLRFIILDSWQTFFFSRLQVYLQLFQVLPDLTWPDLTWHKKLIIKLLKPVLCRDSFLSLHSIPSLLIYFSQILRQIRFVILSPQTFLSDSVCLYVWKLLVI